jgi:hypothetical protein
MDNNSDQNVFREVHRKVKDVKDKASRARHEAARHSQRTAEDRAEKKGLERLAVIPQPEDESE